MQRRGGPDGDIARYYDRNTPRFLLVGGGRNRESIHRELWGPGIATVTEASNYINVLISGEVRGLELTHPLSVVDMGCGVGGTLFYLAETLPDSRFVGVTISARQHAKAVRLNDRKGLGTRCRFILADFQEVDLEVQADVIVAVESFVHSDSIERFLEAMAGHLRGAGYLFVADDFLSLEASRLSVHAQRQIADFKAGWHVPSLCTVEGFTQAAAQYGFTPVRSLELSNLIRLARPRDRVIARLSPLFRRLNLIDVPFLGNMIGGNALQIGLRERFLRYHLLVLQKG